jgi:hypothetical protein
VEVNYQPHALAALAPVTIEYGMVWAPGAVWRCWEREESLGSAEIPTLAMPVA